jgi:ribonucleoside-diphosphate reductase alpha chain
VTHKFSVGGHEGYITVGLFEDGSPGELFVTMAKEGSTIGGLMDTIGTQTSLCLQYGVPLLALVDKFTHMRFEPAGWTNNPDIPNAKSVVDYIFRWAGIEFIPGYREANTPQREVEPAEETATDAVTEAATTTDVAVDASLFVPGQGTPNTGLAEEGEFNPQGGPAVRSQQFARFQSDAPACDNCGAITVRNGNCYLCHNCGNSMGCS